MRAKGLQFFQRIGMVDFLVNIRVHAVFRRKRHACQLRLKINHPVKKALPLRLCISGPLEHSTDQLLITFITAGAILCTVLIFRSISQEKAIRPYSYNIGRGILQIRSIFKVYKCCYLPVLFGIADKIRQFFHCAD